jgi:hypothetical protein
MSTTNNHQWPRIRVAIATAAALVVGGVAGHFVLQPTQSSSGVQGLHVVAATCPVSAGATAVTIQAAMQKCANGGTVEIAAGTYALTDHMTAQYANEVISGAGQTLTSLVQHSRVNIFQITAPNVTIENMSVDTGTYNPSGPLVSKNPVPGTIFSAQSHTSILNVSSFAGVGFGIRITGSNPCDAFPTTGTILSNVTSTNAGSGGYTSLDIDCTNGATLTNINIKGDYIAFYQDENLILNGEVAREYINFQKTCVAPWFISGPSNHLQMLNVDGAGAGVSKASKRGPVTFLTVTNNTKIAGC